MIKLSPTGLVNGLFNRFKIWQDAMEFYENLPKLTWCRDPAGVPCFGYRDIGSINKDDPPIKLIDCLTEGWHSNDFFRQYRTDCHYIIFSNGNWDTKKLTLPCSYDLCWQNWFLFEMADTFNSPNRFCYYIDKEYDFVYPKPHEVVSTIANHRSERHHIMDLLNQHGITENSIIRYSGQYHGVPCHDDIIRFRPGEFDPYTSVIERYYHNVSQTIPVKIYNRCYVNLVVETDVNIADSFFLTEKTIKAIITGMPFVMMATPGFLRNLHQLGFQTYGDIWDESYDGIRDFETRMLTVIDLLKYLKSFDWNKHRSQLIEIARLNRSRFQNLQSLVNQEMERLDWVLRKNFSNEDIKKT